MSTVNMQISGGEKLAAKLQEIAANLGKGGAVDIGFLPDSTYPDTKGKRGLHVATVAFWNEFGTVRSPPRPFFRRMIAAKSPRWGSKMAQVAKAANYDANATLARMGESIQGQLVQSINDLVSPPLAASTIARKGFSKPLIDTGVMVRGTGYEVRGT